MARERGPYELGGVLYKTKAAITKRAKELLHTATPNVPFEDADLQFVSDLLARHPDVATKTAKGIAHLTVGLNSVRAGLVSPSYWIVHPDGTHTTFSYKTCIGGHKTAYGDFCEACREAVVDSVLAFKRRAFDGRETIPCAITGAPVTWYDCEVDHETDFKELVAQFLCETGIDVESVKIGTSHGAMNSFLDDSIRQRWCTYHDEHVRLRVTSVTANQERNMLSQKGKGDGEEEDDGGRSEAASQGAGQELYEAERRHT